MKLKDLLNFVVKTAVDKAKKNPGKTAAIVGGVIGGTVGKKLTKLGNKLPS